MGEDLSYLSTLARIALSNLYPKVYTFAAPAAGQDPTVTVPGNVAWQFASMVATLTTASGGGARYVRAQLTDGNDVYLVSAAVVSQSASSSILYSWFRDAMPDTVSPLADVSCMPLPETWLQSGHQLQLVTDGLAAADQWGQLVLRVHEMSTGEQPLQPIVRGVGRVR